jgi:ribosome-binding factor A
MPTSRRPQRVALQIQQEVSIMISRNMKDRRIGFVTVTGVQMSPDLKHARIYVSLMGSEEEKKESLATLIHAAGWVRHELGQKIRMKFVPEIVFLTDTSQDYGEHIDELINKIHNEHKDE